MRRAGFVVTFLGVLTSFASAHAQDTLLPTEPPAAAPAPVPYVAPPPDMDTPVVRPPPEAPPPEVVFAPEPPAPAFGARGQFVLSGGTSAGITSASFDGSDASRFSVTVGPSLDYFVLRNVSIGLTASVSYSDAKGYGADSSLVETTTTSVSGGVRFGLNVPLARVLSLYPRVTLGVESLHRELALISGRSLSIVGSAIGTPATTQSGPWIDLSVPLLLHPVPHFFIGAGPVFFHAFGRAQEGPDVGGQRTNVGATLILGGHWGGDLPATTPAEPAAPPPTARERRFGDRGQLALSNEIGASLLSQSHQGTSSSSFSANVSPALDYFVANHLAVGLTAGVSYVDTSGIDPTNGSKVTFTRTRGYVGPRLGFDLPIARWLSWYPRAAITLGWGSTDEASGLQHNKADDAIVNVSLYAPLLVHPVAHLFVGFGPFVGHDLSHSYGAPGSSRTRQLLETDVGANLVVGGWL